MGRPTLFSGRFRHSRNKIHLLPCVRGLGRVSLPEVSRRYWTGGWASSLSPSDQHLVNEGDFRRLFCRYILDNGVVSDTFD